uniref:hypothetical protein n=2 Tax=Flavobacterium sp. TaxID=239 RepID=UPI00404A25FF
MKTKFLFFFLSTTFLFNFEIFAQDKNPELVSVYGTQIELSGINIHKEIPISKQIVIRPETGFGLNLAYGSNTDGLEYELVPKLEVGGKWYYNLNHRVRKNKNTADNAANFFALTLSYYSDLFTISNRNSNFNSLANIIPNWGFRRNLGQHFNYEFVLGYGNSYEFKTQENGNGIYIDFKIGYKFH